MKLCSACLLGINCRYKGDNKLNQKVLDLLGKEMLIPVCPEQLGGLMTPRNPGELNEGRVIDNHGGDQTNNIVLGITEAMKLVELYDIKEAVLKQKSPTCGCGKIYDGTFSGKLIDGDGLFTKALKEKGINVISEEEL